MTCGGGISSFTVNGGTRTVDSRDPDQPLLYVLRNALGLTGAKYGCGLGQCGACTVLVDGRRLNSCLALAVSHDGAEITTADGLAAGDDLEIGRAHV